MGYNYNYNSGHNQSGVKPSGSQTQTNDKKVQEAYNDMATSTNITLRASEAKNVVSAFAVVDQNLNVINSNIQKGLGNDAQIANLVKAVSNLESETLSLSREIKTQSSALSSSVAVVGNKVAASQKAVIDQLTATAATSVTNQKKALSNIQALTERLNSQMVVIAEIQTAVQGFPAEFQKVFYQYELVNSQLAKMRDSLRETIGTITEFVETVVTNSREIIVDRIDQQAAVIDDNLKTGFTTAANKADKRFDVAVTAAAILFAADRLGKIFASLHKKSKAKAKATIVVKESTLE